jgi:hypothetical protein
MTLGTDEPSAPMLLRLAAGQHWLVHLSQGTWVACRTGRARLREGAAEASDWGGLTPCHDLRGGQGLSLRQATWISLGAVTACTLEIRAPHDAAACDGNMPEPTTPRQHGALHALLARLGRLHWVEAR